MYAGLGPGNPIVATPAILQLRVSKFLMGALNEAIESRLGPHP
jgi:hypothetical protein